jgi:hypothetical protein
VILYDYDGSGKKAGDEWSDHFGYVGTILQMIFYKSTIVTDVMALMDESSIQTCPVRHFLIIQNCEVGEWQTAT